MPELPEVQTVKSTLEKLIIGKEIERVEVIYNKVIKNVDENEFTKMLINEKFHGMRRRGKYLLFDLTNKTLVSHLRMEGKYNYNEKATYNPTKHDLVIFHFTDGTRLIYNDVRKFGTMEVVANHDENSLVSINKLGPEPFDLKASSNHLYNLSRNKKKPIKNFLLDQEVLVGLGNIYVDETLYKCNIHPLTPAGELSKTTYKEILVVIKEVLQEAIDAGGTTIKSFAISGDVHGKFQHNLKIYGKKDCECEKCGTKIIKMRVGGRGTHICPKCQEEPKTKK